MSIKSVKVLDSGLGRVVISAGSVEMLPSPLRADTGLIITETRYGWVITPNENYPEWELMIATSAGQNIRARILVVLTKIDFDQDSVAGDVTFNEIAGFIRDTINELCEGLLEAIEGPTKYTDAAIEAVRNPPENKDGP